MDQEIIGRLLAMYGISYSQILKPQKGYRNTTFPVITKEQTLNLIIFKNEIGIVERINRANKVGNYLADHGLPARKTYRPEIIAMRSKANVRYAGIYNYLSGDTLPWEGYSMVHLKDLGRSMAEMHTVLQDFNNKRLPLVSQECLELNNRLTKYFSDPGVKNSLGSKLNLKFMAKDFTSVLNECSKLPRQALHMDFVRGNILFNERKQVTGILDFEKVACGARLFDVARTLAFLLIDCKYKPEIKVRKYFLSSGYIKHGGQQLGASLSLLEELVNFFMLHDFYKFLRHNPYEFLRHNEHYLRTRSYLLSIGLIAEV